jgi:hypothetical protein
MKAKQFLETRLQFCMADYTNLKSLVNKILKFFFVSDGF